MKYTGFVRGGCALLLLAGATTSGPEAWAARQGIGIYVDQDLLVPGVNEDRDYTMGLAVEFFAEQGRLYQLDGFVHWLGDFAGLPVGGTDAHRSYVLGTVNYTPGDLSRPDPIHDDRPYASLLYLSNKRVVADRHRAVGVEFLVGLLGTDLAGEFQKRVHHWWRDATGGSEPVKPRGWRHQISDGGELTARVRFSEARLLERLSAARWWDLAWSWDASLGYQTNASLGLSGRVGKLNSPFWTLPFDPINRGSFVPGQGADELYVWAALRGRGVLYDALLQGQFRDSAVTVDRDAMSRLVLEGAIGVTKSWEDLQLTLAVNGKSSEADLPGMNRNHYWGGMYLNLRF